MRNFKLILWILIVTLFESMFGTYIKIGNIMPDLLFVFALCYAAEKNSISSVIVVSVVCGAIADSLSGRIFGHNLSIFLITSVLVCMIRENIFKSSVIISFLMVFVFSIFGKSLYYVANIGVLKDAGYFYSLFRTILPETLYNTCVSVIIVPLLKLTLKKRSGLYR